MSIARVAPASFELDGIEFIDGKRWEIHGRWSGVEGRDFGRPELTFTVNGAAQRLLAELTGLPWTAVDGRAWHASFRCTIDPADALDQELTVGPDTQVAFGPTSPRPRSRRRRSRVRQTPVAPAATEDPPVPDTPLPTHEVPDVLVQDGNADTTPTADAETVPVEHTEPTGRAGGGIPTPARRPVDSEFRALRAERDAAIEARGRFAAERDAALAELERAKAELGALQADRIGAAPPARSPRRRRSRRVWGRLGALVVMLLILAAVYVVIRPVAFPHHTPVAPADTSVPHPPVQTHVRHLRPHTPRHIRTR